MENKTGVLLAQSSSLHAVAKFHYVHRFSDWFQSFTMLLAPSPGPLPSLPAAFPPSFESFPFPSLPGNVWLLLHCSLISWIIKICFINVHIVSSAILRLALPSLYTIEANLNTHQSHLVKQRLQEMFLDSAVFCQKLWVSSFFDELGKWGINPLWLLARAKAFMSLGSCIELKSPKSLDFRSPTMVIPLLPPRTSPKASLLWRQARIRMPASKQERQQCLKTLNGK